MIGMLWFDNDPKSTLAEKVIRAAAYYAQKYGRQANVCFVHPDTAGAPTACGAIQVRTSRQVLVNHYWLGVEAGKDGE